MENRHYLSVSKETLEERIQYVLDERNHEELDEIGEEDKSWSGRGTRLVTGQDK